MTVTREQPRSLGSQLWRFGVIGGLAAVVDFGVYFLLLDLGLLAAPAKGISFILGTTTAYLLNRRFTFAGADGGKARFAGFLLLYGTTFVLNVSVNTLALTLLPDSPLKFPLAWVLAQGAATVVNFVMLRTVVFRFRT